MKRSAKGSKGGAKLSTVEAAILGSGASIAAQALTTPLDVVRTRVMTAPTDDRAAAYEGARGDQTNDGRVGGGGEGSARNCIGLVARL